MFVGKSTYWQHKARIPPAQKCVNCSFLYTFNTFCDSFPFERRLCSRFGCIQRRDGARNFAMELTMASVVSFFITVKVRAYSLPSSAFYSHFFVHSKSVCVHLVALFCRFFAVFLMLFLLPHKFHIKNDRYYCCLYRNTRHIYGNSLEKEKLEKLITKRKKRLWNQKKSGKNKLSGLFTAKWLNKNESKEKVRAKRR